MLKVELELSAAFRTPAKLNDIGLVMLTWTALVYAVWPAGAVTLVLTFTATPLRPLVKPARCASYWASVVIEPDRPAIRSFDPARAALSAAFCICRCIV